MKAAEDALQEKEKVLMADSDKLTYPLAEPWARLVHLVQQKGSYSHIVTASGSFGKNILPRAAALLDVSPITDVIEISGSHKFVRPIYAGNALCTVRYIGSDPCMLTIRSTSFPVAPISDNARSDAAPISQVDLSTFGEDAIGKSRYIKLSSQNSERPDLGNARVVITGGRALKSAENFKMIDKLAEKLGAAAIEVIGKRIKMREGAPFMWRLLERGYAMVGRPEATTVGEQAKFLETAYFK